MVEVVLRFDFSTNFEIPQKYWIVEKQLLVLNAIEDYARILIIKSEQAEQ